MKDLSNLIIEIKTVQQDEKTKEKNIIKTYSNAFMKSNKSFDIISYEEENLKSQENKTVLKVEKDSLTMIRYGQVSSKLYFKKDVSFKSPYCTHYGNFEIEIYTRKLEILKKDKKEIYKINIEYDINIKNLFEGFNTIDIILKRQTY